MYSISEHKEKTSADILRGFHAQAMQDKAEVEIQSALSNLPPLLVMGTQGELYVYYGVKNGKIYKLKAGQHKGKDIRQFEKPEILASWLFPEKDVRNLSENALLSLIGDYLLDRSGGKVYNPESVRALGAWPEQNGLMYNAGTSCWRVTEGGELVQSPNVLKGTSGEYRIYDKGDTLLCPTMEPMSAEEARAVMELFSARPWKQAYAAEVLTGWTVCAILGAFLPFRPHIWVNAPAGSGKTELKNAVCSLLGGSIESNGRGGLALVMGGANTTEAAVRRALRKSSRPVVMDEMEANGEKRSKANIAHILELARSASYGEAISKTQMDGSGEVENFIITSCFLFFAIRNSLNEDSDMSRFLVLDIEKLSPGEKLATMRRGFLGARDKVSSKDYTARLLARVLSKAPFIKDDAGKLASCIEEAGVNGRTAQMLGEFMAGEWHLLHDEPLSPEFREHAVGIAQGIGQELESENEALLALRALGDISTLGRTTVRQALETCIRSGAKESEARGQAERELGTLNMTYLEDGIKSKKHPELEGKQLLKIHPANEQLKKNLRDSSYLCGRNGFKKTLLQAPGVTLLPCKQSISGKVTTTDCLLIPIEYILNGDEAAE